MSLEVKVNRTKKVIELYKKEDLVAELSRQDFLELLDDLEFEKENNRPFFREFKKISFEVLEETFEDDFNVIDTLEVIDIRIEKMVRLPRSTHFGMTLISSNGDEFDMNELAYEILEENFDKEHVWDSYATNHEIRECFDEELLNFIKNHPKVVIKFNDQIVEHKVLFDDKRNHFFEFGINTDT